MSDDFNNRASDHFISTLKNFLTSLSYPKGKISSDDSLKTNLAEFQRYKRLSVTNGSLNAETFQALGEELILVQIEILTLHHPELRHLFIGRRRNGFLFRPTLQPEMITLDLNIVYEQNRFTETQARETLKGNILDLKHVFSQIKIEFNVFLTPGTGTDYDKATGFYNKIAAGAKEGIINMFLYRNDKDFRYMSFTSFPVAQIMFSKGNTTNGKFGSKQLAHEVGHLLLAFAGDGFIDSLLFWIPGTTGVFNVKQDWTEIDPANSWMRNGLVKYGRDWHDDYRQVKNTSGSDRRHGATDRELSPPIPSILDLYRVGAKRIAAQTK